MRKKNAARDTPAQLYTRTYTHTHTHTHTHTRTHTHTLTHTTRIHAYKPSMREPTSLSSSVTSAPSSSISFTTKCSALNHPNQRVRRLCVCNVFSFWNHAGSDDIRRYKHAQILLLSLALPSLSLMYTGAMVLLAQSTARHKHTHRPTHRVFIEQLNPGALFRKMDMPLCAETSAWSGIEDSRARTCNTSHDRHGKWGD